MVKQFFYTVLVSASFLFSTGVIALNNNAKAEEVKKEAPCYGNKCYAIIIDCPKNCLNSIYGISFDGDGKSNIDTIFAGCVFLSQKRLQNEYNARLDCDNDGKADVIFKLTFSDCEGNMCGKGKGSYIRKFKGNVVKSCKLAGYVTYCTDVPQNELQ